MTEITHRQKLLAYHYARVNNKSQAAKLAGYSKKSINKVYTWFKNPKLLKLIEEEKKRLNDPSLITTEVDGLTKMGKPLITASEVINEFVYLFKKAKSESARIEAGKFLAVVLRMVERPKDQKISDEEVSMRAVQLVASYFGIDVNKLKKFIWDERASKGFPDIAWLREYSHQVQNIVQPNPSGEQEPEIQEAEIIETEPSPNTTQ